MAIGLGIIADDYTGALMVAGYLEAAGIPCPCVADPAALAGLGAQDVVILATRTRLIPAAEAVAEVDRLLGALLDAGCGQVAYKTCATFDSTDAGNIGPIADLLADRLAQRPLVLSAGFPAFRVSVHEGYLFYRGRLVSESIKQYDPLTPMSDPDLVRALSRQTRARLGLLAHMTLVQGAEVAGRALSTLAAEADFILADTSDDGDVAVTSQLVRGHRAMLASDPLIIRHALDRFPPTEPMPQHPPHAVGPGVVLAGSVGPVALGQLARFAAEHPVLTLDLTDPRDDDAMVAAALGWAAPHLGARPLAVTTATDHPGVLAAQQALGIHGAAARAEALLGAVAAGLVARGARRIVVAGGETSGAVVRALGIGRLHALPQTAAGTGFCIATDPLHLSLFLKPGKVGTEDVLLRAFDIMQP